MMNLNLPRLRDHQRDSLDTLISREEIVEVIRAFFPTTFPALSKVAAVTVT